jgi:hypothetical protein
MVFTLIAAASAYVANAIGISLAAATFAVNFALSYVVTRMFADNPEQQQDMGVRQQVPPSAVNAIPIVYGDAYMGGTFVDAVLSTDQKTMYYVLAISSISPNGQFSYDTADMYYGDRKITFDGTDLTKVVSLTDEAGNVNTQISGNLYISLYKSTAAGVITSTNGASAPSTVMGGSDIDVGLRWPSTNRQMNGLAFAIVKLVYNRDAGTTNLSPVTFHVSHYLNGTGVAKAGDVWFDYLTNAVYGGAVDTSFVNSASATALNAYSDELITFTNSSGSPATQPRYRINGVLDAGQSVLSNIDRIVSACDSWMTYNAALGQWSLVINKPESTAYAFNDNNIVGEIRVSATDITSSINQVEARFPFKNNRDQAAFVNIETPSGLLYPNEPVNKYSITYDLVNDSVQAHYLANRLLEQAREDLIVGFSTTYYGIQVDAGDVVSVTNSDYGWNAKLFRVMKVNEASLPDGSLGAHLELNEYNAAVYDNADITQFSPVPNSNLPSVNYFSPLSAPTITSSNPSSAIPNFNVQISIPAVGRVTIGELYYTTSATPTASDWLLLTTAGRIDGEPVTPSTYYTFANQVLPTGASTTATYYFSYIVGNDISRSNKSPTSAAFTWTPTANAGPTGPTGSSITGPTGATGSAGATGTDGVQTARPVVYQWALSTPSISGSTTYTWATGVYTAPSGWSTTITAAPSQGFILYTATSPITAAGGTTTTTINWTLASIVTAGYAGTNGATGPTGGAGATGPTGTNGASARIMYARIANNPVSVAGTVSVSGDNRPSGAQASAVWGAAFNVTWYASDPDPASNSSLYQSEGIYNGTNTVWTAPYISSLKVGQLSAITVNTGSLTVDGTLTVGSAGQIMGGQTAYATGTGFFLGYSSTTYKFSIGSSSQSLKWDGSALTVTGNFFGNGSAEFTGTNAIGLVTAALKVNTASAANFGVYAYGDGALGRGSVGVSAGSAGAGVAGAATASGARAGVLALASGGATVALEVSGGAMVIDNTTLVANLNADLLDGQNASAFVNVAGGTTNAKYLYYVNNNTAPTDPVNRAAWIKVSTNDGAVVWFPGYV